MRHVPLLVLLAAGACGPAPAPSPPRAPPDFREVVTGLDSARRSGLPRVVSTRSEYPMRGGRVDLLLDDTARVYGPDGRETVLGAVRPGSRVSASLSAEGFRLSDPGRADVGSLRVDSAPPPPP